MSPAAMVGSAAALAQLRLVGARLGAKVAVWYSDVAGHVRRFFDRFDPNGSQVLSAPRFRGALRELNDEALKTFYAGGRDDRAWQQEASQRAASSVGLRNLELSGDDVDLVCSLVAVLSSTTFNGGGGNADERARS